MNNLFHTFQSKYYIFIRLLILILLICFVVYGWHLSKITFENMYIDFDHQVFYYYWIQLFTEFLFDPYAITYFFNSLIAPVIPIIILGIWIGHSRLNFKLANFYVNQSIVNFITCGVPLLFIFNCIYSSLHIIFITISITKTISRNFNILLNSSEQNLYAFLEKFAQTRAYWFNGHGTVVNPRPKLFFQFLLNRPKTAPDVKLFLENLYFSKQYSSKHNLHHFNLEWFIRKSVKFVNKNVHDLLLTVDRNLLINTFKFRVDWGFIFDKLAISMFFVVSSITFIVILFAWIYIKDDERRPVFFFLLTVFAAFIIVLVSSQNYLMLFIGWEGVGLSSFLLINFWYTRLQANKAAIKAVLINRVGDIFLIAALSLIYYHTKTLDFMYAISIFVTSKGLQENIYILEFICLFLFLAAVGKSAQLGLHTWLPDAIEGPTPVSALLHAATMVTAGIYLLIRSSPLLVQTTLVSTLIVIVGLLTALFAATSALIQYDIKKVIAYSTCSQLGYMIFSLGLKQYTVSFFHLFNHAFFKALLFIAAGVIIHNLFGEQDIRKMGGLGFFSTYVFSLNAIGTISLAGSLFISGFYSKDLIIESGIVTFTVSGLFIYWMSILTAIFTAVYTSDSLDDVFLEETNARRSTLESIHSISAIEIFALAFLCLFSLFSGYVFKDIFIGLGSDFLTWYDYWGHLYWIKVSGVSYTFERIELAAEFLPVSIKILPIICTFLISIGVGRYERTVYKMYSLITFLSFKWYFDSLQNILIGFNIIRFSYAIFWIWDKYIFEQFRLIKFRYSDRL